MHSEFDHAVFILKCPWGGEEVHCLLAMHIDDGLARCTSMIFLTFIKCEIKKAFRIKDLGPLQNFLSGQFECNLETCELWIHQEMFIDSLLAKYDLTNCNAVKTPLDSDHPFGLPTDIHVSIPNLTHVFQQIVGSLLFLQICSCPDISFAVLLLFLSIVPLQSHVTLQLPSESFAISREFTHITYITVVRANIFLSLGSQMQIGLVDKKDHVSVSGFVWSLVGGPISWSAKKQNCITLSTTEAEYIALTCAIQERIWL